MTMSASSKLGSSQRTNDTNVEIDQCSLVCKQDSQATVNSENKKRSTKSGPLEVDRKYNYTMPLFRNKSKPQYPPPLVDP